MNTTRGSLATIAGMLLVAACSDGTGPTGGNVSLSFSTRLPGSALAPSRAPAFGAAVTGTDTLTDGTNTLIITKAEIVLREIELEPVEVTDCDVSPKPAGCEEFEVGPVLVDLPLGPGAVQHVAIEIPPGSYKEIEFEIHKISKDAPEEAAFRTAHPEFVEKSIRVQGTFNGQAFTYETDLDVEQEEDFATPLVITETTTSTNLTIRVGLAAWFKALDGSLVNPATGNKGGQNESLVKENIKQSIEAFEDDDHDGHEG
jgi:hypothetical protein